MEVLQSLGLDITIAYQFVIFFLAYFFLSNFLFKPYLKAFEERQNKTVGQVNFAEEMDQKTDHLNADLTALQRELNTKIQATFQSARESGSKEAKKILDTARTEGENYLSQAGQKIAQDVNESKKKLEAEVPQLSQAIVEKLVGRNI